jgi:hypothetical protein
VVLLSCFWGGDGGQSTTMISSVATAAPLMAIPSSFFSSFSAVHKEDRIRKNNKNKNNTIRKRNKRHLDQDQNTNTNNITLNDVAQERCLRDKEWSERTEIGVECLCKDAPTPATSSMSSSSSMSGEGIVLVCSDQCTYCNGDKSVCGIKSTEALYDGTTGSRIGIGMTYEYLKLGPLRDGVVHLSENHDDDDDGDDEDEDDAIGSGNDAQPPITVYDVQVLTSTSTTMTTTAVSLALEELDCTEDPTTQQITRCNACSVYLGGVPCTSCTIRDCATQDDDSTPTAGGVFAPVMDCSNLQEVRIFLYIYLSTCT